MIRREQLYVLDYYKKNTFMGSDGIINYRVHRVEEETEREEVKDGDGKPEMVSKLEGICWKGPYIFDKTKEEKQYKRFPYTEEGIQELTAWLNQKREEMEQG